MLRTDDEPKPVYWLYQKDEDGEALKTLVDNGTLSEISLQYLGGDYSTAEAIASAAGK